MTPVSTPPVPQHCPSPRELDDLELLTVGALIPIRAFNEPASPITLTLPDDVQEQATAAGAVELVDPEGLAARARRRPGRDRHLPHARPVRPLPSLLPHPGAEPGALRGSHLRARRGRPDRGTAVPARRDRARRTPRPGRHRHARPLPRRPHPRDARRRRPAARRRGGRRTPRLARRRRGRPRARARGHRDLRRHQPGPGPGRQRERRRRTPGRHRCHRRRGPAGSRPSAAWCSSSPASPAAASRRSPAP